jgi:Sec-independent protein translocase protein TatA
MDFNFLGIGIPELILIFVLLFTVAGPKRMVKWAFELGRYAAQLRKMFQETIDAFKREIDVADLDISKDLPKLPTKRFDIVQEANKVVKEAVTGPVGGGKYTSGTSSTASATDASATNGLPTATTTSVPSAPSAQTSDDEKPRYDAWVQN